MSTNLCNYLELNYISFGAVSVGVVVAMFLPKVDTPVFLIEEAESAHNSEDKAQGVY